MIPVRFFPNEVCFHIEFRGLRGDITFFWNQPCFLKKGGDILTSPRELPKCHGCHRTHCNRLPRTLRLQHPEIQPKNIELDVSKNRGTSKSSILMGFSIINYKPSILGYPCFWKHLIDAFFGMDGEIWFEAGWVWDVRCTWVIGEEWLNFDPPLIPSFNFLWIFNWIPGIRKASKPVKGRHQLTRCAFLLV